MKYRRRVVDGVLGYEITECCPEKAQGALMAEFTAMVERSGVRGVQEISICRTENGAKGWAQRPFKRCIEDLRKCRESFDMMDDCLEGCGFTRGPDLDVEGYAKGRSYALGEAIKE